MQLSELVQVFGSQAKVARFYGITEVSVCLWKKRGVPHERQVELAARRPDLAEVKIRASA